MNRFHTTGLGTSARRLLSSTFPYWLSMQARAMEDFQCLNWALMFSMQSWRKEAQEVRAACSVQIKWKRRIKISMQTSRSKTSRPQRTEGSKQTGIGSLWSTTTVWRRECEVPLWLSRTQSSAMAHSNKWRITYKRQKIKIQSQKKRQAKNNKKLFKKLAKASFDLWKETTREIQNYHRLAKMSFKIWLKMRIKLKLKRWFSWLWLRTP